MARIDKEWFSDMMELPKPLLVYFLNKANIRAEAAEALKPSHNSRVTSAVEDAMLQYTLALACERFSVAKKFIKAGNDRLNFLLKKQKTS
jgi:hypothetical protein